MGELEWRCVCVWQPNDISYSVAAIAAAKRGHEPCYLSNGNHHIAHIDNRHMVRGMCNVTLSHSDILREKISMEFDSQGRRSYCIWF